MKKILTMLVVLVMSLSSVSLFAEDAPQTPQTPQPPVEEPAGFSEFYIEKMHSTLLTSGIDEPLIFDLANRNYETAYKVMVSVSGEGDAAKFFSISDNDRDYYYIDTFYTKHRVSTTLRIAPNTPDGQYKLNIKVSFLNKDNVAKETTLTQTVYVKSQIFSLPYVKNVTFDKDAIGKDNKAKMIVTIVNPTDKPIENISVGLNSDAKTSFSLYENFKPATILEIPAKDEAKVEFSVYLASGMSTGNYPVSFDMSFRENNDIVKAYTEAVFVQVNRTADADGDKALASTPRIIVENYSTDIEQIKAGQPFTLKFTLKNTSTSTAVKNMKITVSSSISSSTGTTQGTGGEVFFAAEGSNSFFVNSLGSNATVENEIKLMTKQDVEPGVYQVELSLDYEDQNQKQYQTKETIAFPVVQEQRLDVLGLNIPTDAMAGEIIPVNFQYINKGKSTIYNFSIALEGNFTLDGGDFYVGNLQAGYNDYFDNSIIPTGEGEQKGAIVLKYEDSQGNAQEKREEFTINISAMPDMGGDMMFDENGNPITPDGNIDAMKPIDTNKKGMGVLGWIIVVAVVGGGTVVTIVIIKKKRKAKLVGADNEEN